MLSCAQCCWRFVLFEGFVIVSWQIQTARLLEFIYSPTVVLTRAFLTHCTAPAAAAAVVVVSPLNREDPAADKWLRLWAPSAVCLRPSLTQNTAYFSVLTLLDCYVIVTLITVTRQRTSDSAAGRKPLFGHLHSYLHVLSFMAVMVTFDGILMATAVSISMRDLVKLPWFVS